MQGKPLNTVRATASRVVANPWFAALTAALGTGLGEAFALQALRYERVILLMDPDADGIHCGALVTLFFYRWMRPLLDDGRVGIVRAPLATLVVASPGHPEHAEHHVRSDAELRVTADGVLGPRTRAALEQADPAVLYGRVLAARRRFIGRLITNNRRQAAFAAGWMDRLAEWVEGRHEPGRPGTRTDRGGLGRSLDQPGMPDVAYAIDGAIPLCGIGSIVGIWWPEQVFQASENLSHLLGAIPERLWWLFGPGTLATPGHAASTSGMHRGGRNRPDPSALRVMVSRVVSFGFPATAIGRFDVACD